MIKLLILYYLIIKIILLKKLLKLNAKKMRLLNKLRRRKPKPLNKLLSKKLKLPQTNKLLLKLLPMLKQLWLLKQLPLAEAA
jgi:hypothetical protein